jgi:hypothetical protein
MRSDDEAVWLLERVDEWQQSTHEPRYHPGYFHASQLGESDADLIAQYRGVLAYVPRDNDTLRIFDMGKGIDGDWKRYLKQSKLSVVADEEARHISMPYLRLSGDLDDIVQKSETGDWYVVEVKSTSAFKYSRLKGPEPQHLLQATCYMSATQIPRVIFVYQHRDTGRRRAFYRQFDHNIWSQIVQRLLRLRSEAEAMDGTLDPKIVDLSLRLNAELAK